MKYIAGLLVLGLLIAQQDYWQWNRSDLVFGFLPYTIAWHSGVCLATAAVWLFITTACWPKQLERIDEAAEGPTVPQSSIEKGP